MNIIPMVLDKSTSKEYSYDLYSLLLTNRIIFLNGEVTDENANIIVGELLYLNSLNHSDIQLYINSPGGSVSSGLAIYDAMNFIESNVITIGMGLCASMGAVILSSGFKRYALPNTEIMIHEPIGGVQGQASNIKNTAEHILKVQQNINKILANNTKKSISTIQKDTLKDNYMNAKEAKKYGLIDDIINQSL